MQDTTDHSPLRTALHDPGPGGAAFENHATDFYKAPADARPDAERDPAALRLELEQLRPLAELGRMAATVAHEVRNPLAGISANAELLREALSDPDDIEAVDIILGEVDRLSRLVTDLLLYTRERVPSCGPLDLGLLARRCADLCQSEAERAGVRLSVTGGGVAWGDQALSRQALLNILRNAIQACCVGGVVAMTVDEVEIRIADQGNGIPSEVKKQLFRPFVSGRTRGLGLGLAVARRCLRRQQGDILLEKTGPDGTVFNLIWQEAERPSAG